MGLFRRQPKRNLEAGFWRYDDTNDDDRCSFDIVGESHHKTDIGKLLVLGKHLVVVEDGWTKLGAYFWLVRELRNKHDKNAVAVCASHSDRYDHTTAALVGHLSREQAAMRASDIVQPVPVLGVIVGRENRFGVKLHVGDMTAAGLTYTHLRVHEHEQVVRPLVRQAQKRWRRGDDDGSADGPAARLRHAPTQGDPNAVEVVVGDGRVAGTIDGRERLWGPHVDGLDVKLRLHWGGWVDEDGWHDDEDDDENYLEVEALAKLPDNAHEASDWKCGPYCATIDKTDEGGYQAVGRLLHLRFKVPTCDASKHAFREAKNLNKSRNGTAAT